MHSATLVLLCEEGGGRCVGGAGLAASQAWTGEIWGSMCTRVSRLQGEMRGMLGVSCFPNGYSDSMWEDCVFDVGAGIGDHDKHVR